MGKQFWSAQMVISLIFKDSLAQFSQGYNLLSYAETKTSISLLPIFNDYLLL